jgi:hypothetical protein
MKKISLTVICLALSINASCQTIWSSIYEYCRDSIYRVYFSQGKLEAIKDNKTNATIALSNGNDIPAKEYRAVRKDTLQILDIYGRETLVMKAIKDESTGEMVANEVIDAAVVSARFRNVAERGGKVAIQFDITVPKTMMDSKWQLRFSPQMYVLEDSLSLDPVIVTGRGYRKTQLRGYQQYERFLSRIITDTAAFVNIGQLELFIERNMPRLYAFKRDSAEVSDEQFYSYYGVSEAKAVEHYTNKLALRFNDRRRLRRQKMFDRYVKAPIVTEGIKLDTVLIDINGDFKYCYSQIIDTKPMLRKVDIVLSGAIYEQEKQLYTIPKGDPLTFYISSVASFADMSEKYLTKIIERQATASTSYNIVFQAAKSDVRYDLSDNAEEISNIKSQLIALMENELFELDSIRVTATASPEGGYKQNETLSKRRSESVSSYFRSWMKHYRDSLEAVKGFSIDESGGISRNQVASIPFQSSIYGENWSGLDRLVDADDNLSAEDKHHYFEQVGIRDLDKRESKMRQQGYYKYLKSELYPRLRTVTFDFYLHRKSMVKDTIHTTVLDTAYMRGVEAIQNRNYEQSAALLAPYQDYNTAVAYVALDRNRSALQILQRCERTAQVNYMLALVYSRLGDEGNAVQCYMASCRQDPAYVHRGNLDPEISELITLYGVNKKDEEELY